MLWFILFIFGLAIGSFLNVVSLRYEPGNKVFDLKIINGRSNCLHCHTKLKWYELIPLLSFIIQLGKCRSCGNKLSWQYPIVELLSGLIFVLVPYTLVDSGYTLMAILIWILIFLLFLLLSIIDFRHYIIPDSINLSLAILGVILVFLPTTNYQLLTTNSFMGHYSLLFDFSFLSSIWLNHIFAAFIAMAFVAAIIILSRGRGMGWGDFKLVGALGLIFGWPDILMILFLSFIVGSIFVLPLLIKKQKTMKDVVPFGPFLIIASTLTFFLGYQIIDGYFKLFSLV